VPLAAARTIPSAMLLTVARVPVLLYALGPLPGPPWPTTSTTSAAEGGVRSRGGRFGRQLGGFGRIWRRAPKAAAPTPPPHLKRKTRHHPPAPQPRLANGGSRVEGACRRRLAPLPLAPPPPQAPPLELCRGREEGQRLLASPPPRCTGEATLRSRGGRRICGRRIVLRAAAAQPLPELGCAPCFACCRAGEGGVRRQPASGRGGRDEGRRRTGGRVLAEDGGARLADH
jgi:hypothetical protein